MLNSEITKLDSVVGPQRSIYWQRQTGKGVLGKAPLWRAAPCPSSLGVSEQQMRSHRGKQTTEGENEVRREEGRDVTQELSAVSGDRGQAADQECSVWGCGPE